MRTAALIVACPGCARRIEYSERNPWRPFCSERCRGVDLGAWASERFRIAGQREPGESDEFNAGIPPDASRG
ncbi:MAG: DNA gyrase inhibitor YacG [Burkholderiaceae bacterium]|nr:DNA gyrase inhibitor YacG [Burkholderiaceae bacterium]